MTTSTSEITPLEPPETPQKRLHPAVRGVVVVVVGLVLIAIGSLIGLRLARAGVLPGVTVDGVAIGGASTEQVHGRLRALAGRKAAAEIVAVRDEETSAGTAAELGYTMDVDATVAQALYRGRQGNPIAALADQLRAFTTTIPVAPVESVDS